MVILRITFRADRIIFRSRKEVNSPKNHLLTIAGTNTGKGLGEIDVLMTSTTTSAISLKGFVSTDAILGTLNGGGFVGIVASFTRSP
jgi:hypothetical protein